MSPTDPRHGTTSGFHAGCRDSCCRRALAKYEKARRLDKLRGGRAIPALGAQRRIQALMRLGWSSQAIADAAGLYHRNRVLQILNGQKGKPARYIECATHKWVCAVYDQLSMRVPDDGYAKRTAAFAAKRGWPPPLAWDDIDNPNEHPAGWEYRPADRATQLADLAAEGIGITEASRRLGVKRDSLEAWCRNNGHNNLYLELAVREALSRNQYTKEAS